MEENKQVLPSWDDLVFHDRNQGYGAYELRKLYKEYLNRALIIAVIFFITAMMLPFIWTWIKSLTPEEPLPVRKITYTELTEPPSIDKNKLPPPDVELPPMEKTTRFLPPEVKPDEQVPEEQLPTVEELKESPPAVETRQDEVVIPQEGTPEVEEETVYQAVEEMPEPPGGMGTLNSYLAKNIKYPEIAKRAGMEGKVVVRFIVDKNGKVKNPVVLKSMGAGMDEEAVRVISNMPDWTPGRQNGRSVSAFISVTVKFQLKN